MINSHTLSSKALSLNQFCHIGQQLALILQSGDVLMLYGELGAGKTTFTQCLATGLEIGEDQYVSSPSFALLHEYHGRLPLFHMDLYRLTDEDDIEAAGLTEYLSREGVCCIEWPDRLGELIPEEYLGINIRYSGPESRILEITPHGESWNTRVEQVQQMII